MDTRGCRVGTVFLTKQPDGPGVGRRTQEVPPLRSIALGRFVTVVVGSTPTAARTPEDVETPMLVEG